MPYLPEKKHKNKRPKRKRIPTGNQKFYQSKLWKRTRSIQLSEYPICQVHEYVGLLEPANVVDHVIGIRATVGGSKTDPANLASMCKCCHDYKSSLEIRNPYLVGWEYSATGKVAKNKDVLFELLSKKL